MAVASYSTRLITITESEATTGFTAIGGGGGITAETDFFIQNANCVSKATAATWDTAGGANARGGVIYNNGAGVTIPTDGAVLTWIYWWGPNALATKASGGAEIIYGNLSTAYYAQYVSGSDDWQFGGWRCYPVDPGVTPRDRTVGAPTGVWQWFGWQANVGVANSIGKGNPYGIDAIRYGRCDLTVTGGQSAAYGTVLGAANWDNTVSRRLGLLLPRDGAYYMQGLFQLGVTSVITATRSRTTNVATLTTGSAHGLAVGDTVVITSVGGTGYNATAVVTVVGSTTSFSYANTGTNEGSTADTNGVVSAWVDFRDSNRVVFIQNTEKVSANFNRIEIRNNESIVQWTAISVTALGTVSKGRFEVIEDFAAVDLTSCTFTDMDTFIFKQSTNVTDCIFRRCNTVTQNSADITGCTFDSATGNVTVVSDNPTNLSNNTFISDGFNMAIQCSTPGTYTFNGNTYTGYASVDGVLGSEAFYNTCTPTTLQSYATSNQSGTTSLYGGSIIGVAQSFPGNNGKLSGASFWIKKTGSPTGNITVKCYAHSGTFGTSSIPTGTQLVASKTLAVTSSLISTSYALIDFYFGAEAFITVSTGTNYTITLEFSGGSVGNTLDVGTDTSAPTAAGNYASLTGSTWTAASGTDLIHFIYTGGDITLNVSSGDTPSIRNATGCATYVNSAVTVTLTGLKNPSEVRVFFYNTTNEVPGSGAESVTDGDHSFSISSGVAVDIVVLSLGYQNLRILNFSATANASVPVAQVLDRQYLNPA